MKVEITQDVDGMRAGEVHDLRGGYAESLIRQGKAKGYRPPPVEAVSVPTEPIVETASEMSFTMEEEESGDD